MTGAIQERLKQNHDASAYHMMFAVNVYSSFYLAAGQFTHTIYHAGIIAPPTVCILSGEGQEAVGFIYRHPDVLPNLFLFSLTSAVGQVTLRMSHDYHLSSVVQCSCHCVIIPLQLFIFTTITQLGPLTCSIFTTTRKFFTILGSVLLFANPLLPRQWVGVVLVFLGLLLDVFYGKSTKPERTKVKANGHESLQNSTSTV